jgi:hypothetical protein
MTHLQLAVAAIMITLLVAIGWGVRRIVRHTSFVVGFITRNAAEADEIEDEPEPESQPQQDADEGTKPMGFGVRLRERN